MLLNHFLAVHHSSLAPTMMFASLLKSISPFSLKLSNVLAVIGDNCSTNKCIASQLRVPLIGCRSRIFNLAVTNYLKDYEEEIDKVHTVMVQLCQLKNHGELMKFTSLNPAIRNNTQWSST
jgi:hypothetical protein